MQKTALRVAGVIFLLVALLHLARAFWSVAVSVGGVLIPVSASWIGAAVSFVLAVWMFSAAKR